MFVWIYWVDCIDYESERLILEGDIFDNVSEREDEKEFSSSKDDAMVDKVYVVFFINEFYMDFVPKISTILDFVRVLGVVESRGFG